MRPYSARAVQAILLTGILLLFLFHAPVPPPARAGEALRIGAPGPPAIGAPGSYITWNTTNITYTVDGGNLGQHNNATARQSFVVDMFALWQAVPTASLTFTDGGGITSGTSADCVTDGDVDSMVEYNCIETKGFPGNPIIFDADGSLVDALLGPGTSDSLLGFAGPRTTGNATSASHVAGRAVLNGKWVDGVGPTETSFEDMQATGLHEYGHFLGLGHSQINNHCFAVGGCATGSDASFGLPTMYPVSFGLLEAANVPAELTLSMDDVAWISLLYPSVTFAANYSSISGQLLTSDGLGPIQGGNIIARQVDDPATAGIDESLRCAVSVVSGDRFTLNLGQNVSGDNPPPPDPNAGTVFPSTGSHDPTLAGAYTLPVPINPMGGPAACAAAATAGTYRLQAESINTTNFPFTVGSSVGPHGRSLGVIFPIPGTPPAPSSPISVAGGPVTNANIVLVGTNPSSDAFEGGSRNDTVATAAPIGNGTTTASISPMLPTGPDVDVYAFTAVAGQMVTLNINAEATYNTFLDTVMEVVNSSNTRVSVCRAVPGSGSFDQPCMNDDEPGANTFDSRLEFQSPTGGVFFIRIVDWRGDARVDFRYDLVVTGAGPAPQQGCSISSVGSGSWTSTATWSTGALPVASDNVCILAGHTVAYNTTTTVNSIADLTGTLNVNGGTLTATTSVLINGGTLRLTGGSVSTATVNLTGGLLEGSGTLTGNLNQTGGTFGPGLSPGVFNINGDFTQSAGQVLFEIFGTGGAGNPTGHDQINISGNTAVNGTVNVVLDPGYTPALNDTFTLATFANDTGSTATPNLPDISAFGFQFVDVGSSTDFTIQVQPLSACTINFDNSNGDGLWQEANNWDTNTLPASTDVVCIGAGFTVTKSDGGGDSINRLIVADGAGVFTLQNTTLTLAADSTIGDGGFTMNSGAVGGAGNLMINGPFLWNGGSLNGAGTTTVNGGMTLATATAKTLNNSRILVNPGMATWSDGDFLIGNGAVFNNTMTGTFDIQHSGTRNFGGGIPGPRTVNNAGNLTRSAGGGTTAVSATFNNNGVVNVSSGTFQLAGGGTHSGGTFGANAPGTVEFAGGTHTLDATAAIGGNGTILFSGGSTDINGSYSVLGNTQIVGAATVNLNTASALSVTLTQTGGTLAGSGMLTVNNPFTWTGGTQGGTGSTLAQGGLVLNGAVTLNRFLTISGVSTWSSGTMSGTGDFTQSTNSTLAVNISDGSSLQPDFNNNGTITRGAGTGAATFAGNVTNGGTINANTAALNFTGSFQQIAGLTRLNGGTISGGITFDFNGGVLDAVGGSTITGNVNNQGATVRPGMSPGTLNITGNYTQGGGGTLEIELGGTTPGTQFDVLAITGSATLGGTLTATSFGGFTPGFSDSFQIMTFASRSGDFAAKNLTVNGVTLNSVPQTTDYLLVAPAAPSADLAVTKNDSPDPILLGSGNLTYTVTVSNNGPDNATGVVLTDTLPASVTFVSATAPCLHAAGTVTCNLGNLNNGANAVLTIVVTPTMGGVITNTASVTGNQADPVPGNNSDSEDTTVNTPVLADLTVTKSDAGFDPVVVGQNITYTVTIANGGPNDATNVALTDTLPASGIAFVSSTPSQGACGAPVGNTLTCNLGTINNGAQATVTIVITPLAAGTLTNTASAAATETDPTPADNSATEMTTVNAANTSTALISSANPSVFGQSVTFTATVTVNAPGAGTPTGTVDFFNGALQIGTGTLNAGGQATFSTAALAVGTHTITATYNGDTNFNGSTSAPLLQTVNAANTSTALISSANPSVFGQSVTFTATVTVNAPGAGTPTGTVDFFNGAVQIGTGTLNAGGQATFSTSALAVGTHTITATYNGDTNFNGSTSAPLLQTVNQANTTTAVVSSLNPSNTGDNVTFTATVTVNAPGAGTPTGTVDFFDGVVLLGSGALNAGGQATFSTSALTVGSHPITATYNGDANFNGSTSPAITQVVTGVADLNVTKTDAVDPVNVGANIVYMVTIANAGPNDATNVVLTDTLPVAVTFVSAVASQGACGAPVGVTLTCNLGTINNGGMATVTITVTAGVLAAPSVTNTASVASAETDPNTANNTDSETTTVNPVADLSITKTDSPDPVVINNNITYTLRVTNLGPSPATGIVVNDPLPANVTFVSVTAPAGSACTTPAVGATGTVNCALAGMLNSGANVVVTIVVQAPGTAGMVSNTATVASPITDPNAANNSATADTTVSSIIPSTDFSLSVVPINNNVIVGQAGTYTVTVGPLPAGTSFINPIALACMSPTGACSISPNSLTPGLNPASATMTVATSGLLGSVPLGPGAPAEPPAGMPFLLLGTLLTGLLLVGTGYAGKRMQQRRLAPCMTLGLVLLVISVALGQSACPGGARGRQVQGPYTVTVTATSGALSHSTTVTLNVTRP